MEKSPWKIFLRQKFLLGLEFGRRSLFREYGQSAVCSQSHTMGLVLTVVLLGGGTCDKIGRECDLFSSGGVSYLRGGLTRMSSTPSFSPTCKLSYPVMEQCIKRPSEDALPPPSWTSAEQTCSS